MWVHLFLEGTIQQAVSDGLWLLSLPFKDQKTRERSVKLGTTLNKVFEYERVCTRPQACNAAWTSASSSEVDINPLCSSAFASQRNLLALSPSFLLVSLSTFWGVRRGTDGILFYCRARRIYLSAWGRNCWLQVFTRDVFLFAPVLLEGNSTKRTRVWSTVPDFPKAI